MESLSKLEIRELADSIRNNLSELHSQLLTVNHRFIPEGIEDINDIVSDEYDPIDELPHVTKLEKHWLISEYVVKEIKDGKLYCQGIFENYEIKNEMLFLCEVDTIELVDLAKKIVE